MKEKYETFALVIPAFNPDHNLIALLQSIRAFLRSNHKFDQRCLGIILVNDGSSADCSGLFAIAEAEYQCTVLTHPVNLGKGRALKTAFNYFLHTFKDSAGVVTLDSDGQHGVEDVFACAEKLCETPDCLVLGCRNFDEHDVPFKSRVGNKITRSVLSLLRGIKVSDTQTGLRGIPARHLDMFINIPGERFEYEMNMLVSCYSQNIEVSEVSIKTIYMHNNKSTHFRPVVDSYKIYKVFLKYIFSGVSSFLLDILLFTCFVSLIGTTSYGLRISYATVAARVFSSLYNFLINKKLVFETRQNTTTHIIKYFFLALVQVGLSAFLVSSLSLRLPFSEAPVKIAVDSCLFLFSFFVQKAWVFKK